MSYYQDCLEKFENLPTEFKQKVGSLDIVNKIKEIEDQFSVSLKFVVLLVAIGELKVADVGQYLIKELNVNSEQAKVIKSKLNNQIFSIFFENQLQFQLLSVQGIKDILNKKLLDLFTSDPDYIWEFNVKIAYLLIVGDDMGEVDDKTKLVSMSEQVKGEGDVILEIQQELIHLLETNKERLTRKDINLSGKRVEPTVANWLKSFIQNYGVGIYGGLEISKFITSSENCATLGDEDRNNVKKILLLYRNIKFFPDSFINLPFDKWEFVPVPAVADEGIITNNGVWEETVKSDKFSTSFQVNKAQPTARQGGFAQENFQTGVSLKEFDYPLAPWLESEAYEERLESIFKKHGLSFQQQNIMTNILQDLMSGKIRLSDLPTELQKGLFINSEATGLLLRDIFGLLIKPVAQYVPGYNDALLENLGVQSDDYLDPENILTILNQIAIVKESKNLSQQEKTKAEIQDKQEKEAKAKQAQVDLEMALALEEKLKEMYKKVKTDDIKKASANFPDILTKPEDFTKQFYQAINDRATDQVIGALWILAQTGKLMSLLEDDKKIQSLYNKHLTKKYGDQVATDFMEQPNSPAYLSYFLQHLLIDTLDIPKSEAAALTIHLINEYNQATGQQAELLAYGDMTSQDFQWRQIKNQNGKLTLAD